MLLKRISSLLIAILICLLLFNCTETERDRYAEFQISDVSKKHEFIDSTSSDNFIIGPNYVYFEVTGYLDSNAIIEWKTTTGNCYQVKELKKGEINFSVKSDFYTDVLVINFLPKGSKKGKLTIKSRIN